MHPTYNEKLTTRLYGMSTVGGGGEMVHLLVKTVRQFLKVLSSVTV